MPQPIELKETIKIDSKEPDIQISPQTIQGYQPPIEHRQRTAPGHIPDLPTKTEEVLHKKPEPHQIHQDVAHLAELKAETEAALKNINRTTSH